MQFYCFHHVSLYKKTAQKTISVGPHKCRVLSTNTFIRKLRGQILIFQKHLKNHPNLPIIFRPIFANSYTNSLGFAHVISAKYIVCLYTYIPTHTYIYIYLST